MSTWKSLSATLGVVGRHRDCRLYAVSSCLVMCLVTFTAVLPMFEGVLGVYGRRRSRLLLWLAVYLAYGLLYFVTAFGNVALVTGIAAHLDGEASVRTIGWARACRRIGPISYYSLMSATVGLLAYLTRPLIHPLLGTAAGPTISARLWERWRRISYGVPLLMAVPVIALDHPPPKNAFKRGEALVKSTWGDDTRPTHGIGPLAPLLLLAFSTLLTTPAIRQGLEAHDAALVRIGLAAALLASGSYVQVRALVNSIFALAAYRYATGRPAELFPGDASFGERAFVSRPRKPHL